jgi:hypothetical protein
MAIVIPNEGEIELLRVMIKDALSVSSDFTLKLFQNDVTPDESFTAASFTEANFTDYTSLALARASFNDPTLNVSNEAQIDFNAEQSWTCGSTGNVIYGYWVEKDGVVSWMERFAAARTLANGDVLRFTPSLLYRSIN